MQARNDEEARYTDSVLASLFATLDARAPTSTRSVKLCADLVAAGFIEPVTWH